MSRRTPEPCRRGDPAGRPPSGAMRLAGLPATSSANTTIIAATARATRWVAPTRWRLLLREGQGDRVAAGVRDGEAIEADIFGREVADGTVGDQFSPLQAERRSPHHAVPAG